MCAAADMGLLIALSLALFSHCRTVLNVCYCKKDPYEPSLSLFSTVCAEVLVWLAQFVCAFVTYCTILLSVNCEKNLKCAEDTFARLVLFMNALKHET